ncbi:hypothetical protein PROP_03145 [Propionicimonas sp. T2.31MG-18]|uniref:hypothetical protein n=1 Tax=Propionicimonas sp. T2.31MG-18 TaxID=3157620 RepID=UPI0035E78FF0
MEGPEDLAAMAGLRVVYVDGLGEDLYVPAAGLLLVDSDATDDDFAAAIDWAIEEAMQALTVDAF